MPSHYVLCLAQPEVNQTSECYSQLCRSNEANMYSVCLWYHVYLQSSGLWATRIKLFSLTHLMGQMLALQPNRCFPWRICFQYLMMKNCLQRINKCTCVCELQQDKSHPFQLGQQMISAWGNRDQMGWKALKHLFLSVISIFYCPALLPAIAIGSADSAFYYLFSPSVVCIILTKDTFMNRVFKMCFCNTFCCARSETRKKASNAHRAELLFPNTL